MKIFKRSFWWRHEKFITITRDLHWIEIEEVTSFLWWKIKEETREVYLPNMKELKSENLLVIAEAYKELHETVLSLQQGGHLNGK